MLELKIHSLSELQSWLESNCETAGSIWLIFPKKTAGTDFAWSEIVDVLLCYGWIDSVGRKVDDRYTSLRISPRNPKSNWSKVNKNKIARLELKGLLHHNGKKMVDLAKETGTWTALVDVDNLVLPKDFEEYLTAQNLMEKWNLKSKSFKRGFLETLLNSKRPESRLRKINGLSLK
jgi:uncharacterized protein YdeI (YjbR/CyaY-like superfamily)